MLKNLFAARTRQAGSAGTKSRSKKDRRNGRDVDRRNFLRLESLESRWALATVATAMNDVYHTSIDAPLTSNAPGVLANDTASNGQPLSAALFSGPSNGQLTFNADGSFVYTPNAGYSGMDSFVYTASDGDTNSMLAAVTINVSEGTAPVSSNDSYTLSEDNALVIPGVTGVLANDDSASGATVSLVSGPASGELTLAEDGGFVYTPEANFSGEVTFTYQATNSSGVGNIATVTLTVEAVNDVPVANNDSFTVDEDGVLTTMESVLANDTDVEGSTLTPQLASQPLHGTVVFNADGTFTYTPNANFNGIDGFSYLVNDGTSNSEVATVTISVNPVNDAPTAVNDEYSVNEDEALTVAGPGLLENDTDIDSTNLTVALVQGPQYGTVTLNADGSFVYTPNADFFGVDGFSYTTSDGSLTSDVATVTINVAPVNDPPVANNDEYTTAEDTPLSIDAPGVLGNDVDPDGEASLTVTIVSQPQNGTVTLGADGQFVYTPNADYNGLDGFSYTVSDGTETSDVATVTINVTPVNDAPVGVEDSYSVDEDGVLAPTEGVLANDTDVDSTGLTATLGTGPTNGTLTLNADGTFQYTPNANFNGTDTFTYTVSDGELTSSETTVTITVNSVDDVPVAVNDEYDAVEDTPLVVSTGGVLANDSDPEGSALTAQIVSQPQFGTVTLNADGTFNYTPNADYNGVDGFSYTVSDGVNTSDVATVTINISPVNDAPVGVADGYTVTEDTTLNVTEGGLLANDTDVDSTALTAALGTGPTNGTVTLNADGTFSYVPNANFNGEDTFTYTVSDGELTSEAITVTITVVAENDAPIGSPDSYTTAEDTPLSVTEGGLLANDSDPDSPTLTAALGTGPTNGTLELNADGTFVYTPNANFSGDDSFTYTVSDGELTSEPITVTISVTAVNDAPVGAADSYTTSEDTPLTVTEGGLLANDSDPEGSALTAALGTGPANGTLELNADGTFVYTPNANFSGDDSFTYTVSDGELTSEPITVTISVTAVNDAPVGTADSYTVTEDTPLSVNEGGLLSNDSDPEGSSLTAALGTGPANGTVTLNPDGTFVYTPNADFFGEDSFTYTVSDGELSSEAITVTISVTAVNDAPVGVEDAYTMEEDGVLEIGEDGVLGNDTDVDSTELTATLGTGPTNGTVVFNADGTFIYTPNAEFSGTDSFTYTVSDGELSSGETTVTITVTPGNDAPIASADEYAIDENQSLNVSSVTSGVLGNDSDPDGDTLTAAIVTGPTNGTVTMNADGTFVYTPNAGFTGTDTFTYAASDGTATSEAVVTITVNDVSQPTGANNDAYSTGEDVPLDIGVGMGVLANDFDPQGLAMTAEVITQPANGTLTFEASGAFRYVPNENFHGTDSFTYRVTNSAGEVSEGTATIIVEALNDAPQAMDDSYIIPTGSSLNVGVSEGVQANDSDVDAESSSAFSTLPMNATLLQGPQHGTLSFNADGSFIYTPNAGYVGQDSFAYQLSDGMSNSQVARATITVTGEGGGGEENVAPVSAADNYATTVDQTLTISVPGVLSNDTDANGDTLTAQLVANAANGTVTLAADGSFVYVPNAGYIGADSFQYAAFDGELAGTAVTVNIQVQAAGQNTRPIVNNDNYIVEGDSPFTVGGSGVLGNDTDAQGDALVARLFSGPQNGTVTLNEDGSFTYTPNAGYVGTDSFLYWAFDGQLGSSLAAVTLRVTAPSSSSSLAIDALMAGDDGSDGNFADALESVLAGDDWLA
jgi:VCBS repeat-containing protein